MASCLKFLLLFFHHGRNRISLLKAMKLHGFCDTQDKQHKNNTKAISPRHPGSSKIGNQVCLTWAKSFMVTQLNLYHIELAVQNSTCYVWLSRLYGLGRRLVCLGIFLWLLTAVHVCLLFNSPSTWMRWGVGEKKNDHEPVTNISKVCVHAEATTKSKLATLNEKLDILERKLEVLEVQVSSATTNPSVFN